MRSTIALTCFCLSLCACTIQDEMNQRISKGISLPNFSLGLMGRMLPEFPKRAAAEDTSKTRLVLCLKEVQFLPSIPPSFPVRIPIGEGQVAIGAERYEFAGIRVPRGEYYAVTLLTSNGCGPESGVVENAKGRFPFKGEVEFTWRIPVTVGDTQTGIWLPTRSLLTAASRVRQAELAVKALQLSLKILEEEIRLARAKREARDPVRAGAGFPTLSTDVDKDSR